MNASCSKSDRRIPRRHRPGAATLAAWITVLAGLSSPAYAEFDLADKPLYLQSAVPPAFLMAIDDSGSMTHETLFRPKDGVIHWENDTDNFFNNGEPRASGDRGYAVVMPYVGFKTRIDTGAGILWGNWASIPPLDAFGFVRAPELNKSYFNPATTYAPWKHANGTNYYTVTYTDANTVDIRVDPARGAASPRMNVAALHRDRTDDADASVVTTFTYNGTAHDPGTSGFIHGPFQYSMRHSSSSARCRGFAPTTSGSSDVWVTDNDGFTLSSNNGTSPCANFKLRIPSGTVLPAGTEYASTAACGTNLASTGSLSTFVSLANAVTTNANCSSIRFRWTRSQIPEADERFELRAGMVLPVGTVFYAESACGGLPDTDGLTIGPPWRTLSAAVTVSATCTIGFQYYPATFYLKASPTPAASAYPTGFNAATCTDTAFASSGTPSSIALKKCEIKLANFDTAANYQAAIVNFANWYAFYGSRIRAIKGAFTNAMQPVEGMRTSVFAINNNLGSAYTSSSLPTLTMYNMSEVSEKQTMFDQVFAFNADGNTPNRTAVHHIGQQFRRTDDDAPIKLACQINAAMLFTDGLANETLPSAASSLNTDSTGVPFTDAGTSGSMSDIAVNSYVNNLRADLIPGQVPRNPGCALATPDERLDCEADPHMNFYAVTLGAYGELIGDEYIRNTDGSYNLDPFTNKPSWPTVINNAIGAVDDLWHAALNTRGDYINASSPAEITEAVSEIVTSVSNNARQSGGAAVSGARFSTSTLVFAPEFDPADWSGDMKAYSFNSAGVTSSTPVWSAVEQLPTSQTTRNIIVSLETATNGRYDGADFKSDNASITASMLGFAESGTESIPTKYAGRSLTDVINYLRGDKTNEPQFRSRSRLIGDIVNSRPTVLPRAAQGYFGLPAADGGGATGSGSYGAFVTGTKRTRKNVVFVGSNDGMLHAFDASTTAAAGGGDEVFAFIPNGVLDKLDELVKPGYSHEYYVDGSPTISDARIGGAWKSVLVAGLGAGGRSVYALDVTNPAATFNKDNVMWEVTHETNDKIGYVLSRPRVFLGEDNVWYAAFGNGMNSAGHDAHLIMVKLDDGTVSTIEAGSDTGSDAAPNGLGAIVPVDEDNDFKAETIYAADHRGGIWKYEYDGSSWKLGNGNAALFKATNDDGDTDTTDPIQTITGGLEVSRHFISGYSVFFGTGSYVLEEDDASPPPGEEHQIQTFYSIWDKDDGTNGTVTRDKLVQQSIHSQGTSGSSTIRTTSEEPVDYGTMRGWYLDLVVDGEDPTGERFIGEPQIAVGRVIFSTWQPQTGLECGAGGNNWVYALNSTTGANQLDLGVAGSCVNCGAVRIEQPSGSEAPVLSPPVVIDPGESGDDPPAPEPCDPATDADCEPPCDPDDPDCEEPPPDCTAGSVDPRCLPDDDSRLPDRECKNTLAMILASGKQPLANVSCGRLSWRQVK